ncbi:MAG: hypothetical protein ACOCQR_00845 [bacterium]
MSTKIYNAYEYMGNSIVDLLEDLKKAKEKYITYLADVLLSQEIKEIHIVDEKLLDELRLDDKLKNKETLVLEDFLNDMGNMITILRFIAKEERSLLGFILHNLFKVSIGVHPYFDDKLNRERYFIYVYGVRADEIVSNVFREGLFVDFHYQNQTDRPDSIPVEQWNRRREIWDDIIENHISLVSKGFMYDLTDEFTAYEVARKITKNK